MEIDWLTPEEVGNQWGVKARRVQIMCFNGKIPGAIRKGRIWLIPKNTQKPVDGRTKAAKQKTAHKKRICDEHKERAVGGCCYAD